MLNDNPLFEFQAPGLLTLAHIAYLFLFYNSKAFSKGNFIWIIYPCLHLNQLFYLTFEMLSKKSSPYPCRLIKSTRALIY